MRNVCTNRFQYYNFVQKYYKYWSTQLSPFVLTDGSWSAHPYILIFKIAVILTKKLEKEIQKNSKLGLRQLQQIVVSFKPRIFDQRHVEVGQGPDEVQVGTDRVLFWLGSEQVNHGFLDILRDLCEAGF